MNHFAASLQTIHNFSHEHAAFQSVGVQVLLRTTKMIRLYRKFLEKILQSEVSVQKILLERKFAIF